MTVRSTVRQSYGLATDNLEKVGLTPTLASFSKAEPERHTSASVVKPCCVELQQHSMGDLAADSCTICSLRVSKNALLDYEPEGDEVVMEEQEDFFEAFPGEKPNSVAGAKGNSTVASPPDDNIQGSPDLQRKIKALCAKYSPVFSATVHKTPAKVSAMHLNVDEDRWVIPLGRRAPRRLSAEKQEALKEDLDILLSLGVIRYSKEQNASQVLLVKKKPSLLGAKQAWRMCVDYRELNSVTQPEQWPLPNIKDLLERIGAHKPSFFAVLDMTSGYWQTPIAEASRKYTAFTTIYGIFEWCRVPMGLKGACAYFQRAITTQILIDIIHRIVESYLDDLIVFGCTEAEFLANLEELFKRLLASNITLNPKKCRIGMQEIEYVGHTINATGTHFSREKLSSVQQIKKPSTYRDLKSFLGLTNFFRDHIRNYADITSPLNKLVNGVGTEEGKGYRPNKQIVWTPETEQAFEDVKRAVTECPSLFFYDNISPVILMTDASEIGYSAYLFQRVEKLVDGKLTSVDQIIQIQSKCWSGGQVNWSVPEKECYAIFNALKEWEYLLKDIHFTIMTDHKNLVYINDSGAPKVKRWKLLIQGYTFDIVHVPGKDNVVADLLSRLCLLYELIPEEGVEELQTQHIFSINSSYLEQCDKDEAWEELPVGRVFMTPICAMCDTSLQQDVYDEIKAVHNSLAGHSGVKRTLAKLKKRGSSLNGISLQKRTHAVKQFIQECAFCQKSEYRSVKIVTKPFTLANTQRVMNYMSMDTVGPFPADTDDYRYILVLTCTFSRFTMLFPLKSLTAVEAAHALLFHIGIFGAPAEISSDGGSQLVNETIDELLRLTGTEHDISIPYSSQRNAIVERRNKEVGNLLRAIIHANNTTDDWHIRLPFVQRILNAEVVESIGVAPARLLFGEAIDLDRGILIPNRVAEYHELDQSELTDYTKRLIQTQRQVLQLAQEVQTSVDKKHVVERTLAKKANQTEFAENSYVLVSYPDKGLGPKPPNKALTPNAGPFQVVRSRNDGNEYELRNLHTGKLVLEPVSRMRTFHYDKERTNPMAEAIKDGIAAGSALFLVEQVIGHKGGGRNQSLSTLEFSVKGAGTAKPFFVPWRNVRHNILVHEYMKTQPGLVRHIPTRFRTDAVVADQQQQQLQSSVRVNPKPKRAREEATEPFVLDSDAVAVPLTRSKRNTTEDSAGGF